ncbi:MAG: hypothetical protein ACREQV_16560, partial [Candidatus Binatia bacterium]
MVQAKAMGSIRARLIFLILISTVIAAKSLGVAADDGSIHPTLKASHLPELIPTEIFFRDRPTSWRHRISPDGKRLLWVAPVRRRPTIHFRPIDGGSTQTLRTRAPGGVIRWSSDNRRMIFL